MKIKLVEEYYGTTFGTRWFLEIITQANTSAIEISETVFKRIMMEQDMSNMGLTREKPLPAKIEICKQRKEWVQIND